MILLLHPPDLFGNHFHILMVDCIIQMCIIFFLIFDNSLSFNDVIAPLKIFTAAARRAAVVIKSRSLCVIVSLLSLQFLSKRPGPICLIHFYNMSPIMRHGYCMIHRASCIMHHASCIMHHASCTIHNASCISHHASCIMHLRTKYWTRYLARYWT